MDVSITLYHDKRRALKDGTFPIRIRVTNKSIQRYFKTDYSFGAEEFDILVSTEILQGKVSKDLKPLREIRKILDSQMVYFNQCAQALGSSFSWERFNSAISKDGRANVRSGKVYDYFDNYIEELEAYDKIGTAEVYRNARDKFKEYRAILSFDEVTPEFLNAFQRWMIKDGRTKTTVSIYVRALRAIYNQAIERGDANPLLYPYKSYKPPAQRNRKSALLLEDIRKIFNYKTPKEKWKAMALAMFKFSYLTGGMNLTDIANLKHSDIKGDFFTYDRIKTADTEKSGEPIEVHLLPEAKRIRKKYGTGSYYVFPFISLTMSALEKKLRIKQVNKNINKHLKDIAEEVKIKEHVTFYTARHSAATVMMKRGIPLTQISRLLGHADTKTTEIYLASFSQEETKKASEVLLDFD